MGGGPVDTLLVMDAFGEALVVEPYLETCVIGAALLKGAQGEFARRLLVDIVSGTVRLAFAFEEKGSRFSPYGATTSVTRSVDGFVITGSKTMVVGAPAATHLLVTASIEGEEGLGVFAIPTNDGSVTLRSGRTLDGKGVAEVEFSGCVLAADALLVAPAEGKERVAEALDAAVAALCAEAGGVMRRLIRDTLAYLEQRSQFGSALIGFQVLQHRLADMQVRYEQVHAMAFFAAGVLAEAPAKRSVAISAAKVFVTTALRMVAQDAVQMHGAMGVTEELAIGHLFKRATALESELGSIDYHLDRVIKARLPEGSLA